MIEKQNGGGWRRGLRAARGVVAGVGVLLAGCGKSTPSAPPSAPGAASPETVARVHWLGKDRLAGETNAAGLMNIWRELESARLETQTIEKLARAPWRLRQGDTGATNAASALLQPLLGDLVLDESYLEIRQATNQPGELAFAIRLNDQRARLWETNLAAVFESLTGTRATPAAGGIPGWQLNYQLSTPQPSTPSRRVSLTRAGEWTVLGFGPDRNALLSDLLARIQRDHAPFAARATNFWLEADFDLRRVSSALALDWKLPSAFPRISATAIGDGENVRTRAEITLAKPLPATLATWDVPTNLIREPLISFTAVREIRPLLMTLPPFSTLPAASAPGQLYVWDLQGPRLQMFFALPVADAAKSFAAVATRLMSWGAKVIPSERFGSMALTTNASRLDWNGLPFATPFLQAVTNSGPELLFGGFALHAVARTNRMPQELLSHILEASNLTFFDWEITGERLVHWRFLDDAARIVSDAAHMSRFRDDAPGLLWIASNLTNLSHSVTEIKVTDSNRLSFARRSTVGLTAFEIDFLANWLELPQFPGGLGTILATNPTPRPVRPKLPPRPAAEKK